MKRCIAFMIALGLLTGCTEKKPAPDMAKEKAAVEAAINGFDQAYQSKDFEALKKLFSSSPDMVWFGTDSAEVIMGIAGWQAQTTADWLLFESIKMGEPRHLSILIDNDAQLASAIYEVSVDAVIGGKPAHLILRFASTLRKENGEWRFAQGAVGNTTVGQSSVEMLAQMNAAKK